MVPDVLCPVVIGRDREWETLKRGLDRLSGSCGGTLMVSGEAGVGKSRLLREVAAEAGRRRAVVLTGRAVEQDAPLPFRPLTEALFSHLRRSGPPRVAELAPFGPILGRLVPEWHVGGASPGEASLVVVAEAFLRLCAVLGRAAGCVVVLEDLQWADAETIEVLEYAADNVAAEPVLLLGSLRDEPSAARDRVSRLAARRSASIVELGRLGDDEITAVAAACLRVAAVPREVTGIVVAGCDGLPFMVEELLAAMIQGGQLRPTVDGWALDASTRLPVPGSFADGVRRRIDAIPGSRDLLGAAALLGRRFDWHLLAEITGDDEATVADRLGLATDAQILSVEPGEEGPRFRFRHALTREAIVADLLPPQRTRLAARALRAVEAAHPGLPGDQCELAADLAEQAGTGDRAAVLHLEAGRRAAARGALGGADAHLQQALGLAGGDRRLAAEIDEALCEVLVAAGDAARAAAVGERLRLELAALDAPAARLARVELWMARAATVSADWGTARSHLERIAEAGTDGPESAEVDVLAAIVAEGEGRLDAAAACARAALAVADRTGRHDVVCEAYTVLGRCERQRDLPAAEEAFGAALTVANQRGLVLWRIRALHELGTVDLLAGGPRGRLEEARRAALDAGALATAATVALQIGAWFLNRADAEEAFAAGAVCAAEASRLRLSLVAGLGFVIQAGGRALQDRHADVDAAIDHARALSGDHTEVRGVAEIQARAVLALVREDRPGMVAALDAGADLLRGTPVTAPCRGLWALAHALAGDEGAAAAEIEGSGLTSYWLIRGWVGHAHAVTFGLRGCVAEAESAFARADAELARCDWYRHHARRLVAEAALADGWGDPAPWLTEALAFFDRGGPPAVASACRSLLRRAGVQVPRRRRAAPDLPDALAAAGVTPREAEVLALLAGGRSTKDIATRLYLSPKTVERHVANLCAKVGVDGRSELVAFAARHQLGPPLT